MPASWCGIVGFKPTHGLVPYTGIFPIEMTLDHVGPMTKTVFDCAQLLEVLWYKHLSICTLMCLILIFSKANLICHTFRSLLAVMAMILDSQQCMLYLPIQTTLVVVLAGLQALL